MLLRNTIIGILIIASSAHSAAQTNNDAQPSKSKFAVYAGFGPNYYFNNLQIGKNYVNEFNYSFTARFMWEPEHLLSLGFETGYYRLYTFNGPGAAQVHITNTAIPLQVVISMKLPAAFYVNFSMGQSLLHNSATSGSFPTFKTSALSVADFSGTLGYRYKFNDKFSISAEGKYFYSSSFVDKNIALLFVGGFRF
jgi:hypothetical protein